MRAGTAAGARVRLAVLLTATLALAGCGGGAGTGSEGSPAPSPAAASRDAASSPRATATPQQPAGSASSPEGSPVPSRVGTPADPEVLDPGQDLLPWKPAPGPVQDTVTRNGAATLSVDEDGTRARLDAGRASTTIRASARQQVSDTLLDGSWAVVVLQDRQEVRAATATVVDLETGRRLVLDGTSAVPTVNGGTWALGADHLLHATTHRGAYCVASVDLRSRAARRGWCAPERSGFNAARITPAGDALLTFDDSQPSCRTLVRLVGTRVEPFPGVEKCTAWEGLVLEDGAVWSVIPRERDVEQSHVYARTGDSWLDLGPATTGTLTWCAEAAYFVRDPQRDRDDAALMRWNASDGLDVVYESPGGQAFLSAPRCGGDSITLTAYAQSGDEQVSARLG